MTMIVGIWNRINRIMFSKSEEGRYTQLTPEEKHAQAMDLMWNRKIFIGDRECTVRDLISDPLEPVRCPETTLRKAQAQFQRMFMNDAEDIDAEDYLHEKFSKLSAFNVDNIELESRTEYWFKRWSNARRRLKATEDHLAALEQEIELVERQKAEIIARKRGRFYKLRSWFNAIFDAVKTRVSQPRSHDEHVLSLELRQE